MRISDWSSDVCSSDLVAQRGRVHVQLVLVGARVQADVADGEERSLEPILEMAGTRHHREIQPGLLQFSDVLHRQVGERAFVALAAEHEPVHVDRMGPLDRKSVVSGTGVTVSLDIGGRGIIKKNKKNNKRK